MSKARRATSHRRPAASLAVLALGFLTLLGAAPAQAFRGHTFGFTFGGASSSVVNPEPLSEPSAVAANDATGRVYVLDQGHERVEYFSSAGVYEGQFDGAATPAKSFEFGSPEPLLNVLSAGIAADNACYFKHLSGTACSAADPSNGDLYVTDSRHGVVDKFSAAGVYLGQLEQASGGKAYEFFATFDGGPGGFHGAKLGGIDGVSVDASGTVWVYCLAPVGGYQVPSFTAAEPSTFISTAELHNNGHAFDSPGIAVDSEDNLYLGQQQAGENIVSKFSSRISFGGYGTISQPFVSEEADAVAVDLSGNEVFLDRDGSVRAYDSGGVLEESFGAGSALTAAAGLAVSHADSALYSTVYVVDSAAKDVVAFVPEPPGPPSIEPGTSSVTAVTATSATLNAEINPHSEPGEGPASYSFEYGPCATATTCATSPYELAAPIPAGVLPADFEVHAALAPLQGLAPHTAYHYRVTAHNSHPGSVIGEERTFTTQAAVPSALPDDRAWELVSPPEKHGARFTPIEEFGVRQASAAGDAFTYLASGPTESQPAGYTNQVQVLSARGAAGWASRDISEIGRASCRERV